MTDTTVRVVPTGPERDAYLPLFHLADDSVEQVFGYYQTGTLFALDARTGERIGIVLALDEPDGSVELKAVAVDESLQGNGVGTRMLLAVPDELSLDRGYPEGILENGIPLRDMVWMDQGLAQPHDRAHPH